MKINSLRVATALGITGAVLYIACAIASAIWPEQFVSLFATWAHGMDVKAIAVTAVPASFGSYLVGFVTFTIFSFLTGLIFGATYNRLPESDAFETMGAQVRGAKRA